MYTTKTSLLLVLGGMLADAAHAAPPVFERDVRPVVAARCLGCHGGVTHKADLDLRSRESVLKGSRNGAVLSPEAPRQSRLWQVIDEGRMPPEEPALAPREKTVLLEWIAGGARFLPDEAPHDPSTPSLPVAEIVRRVDQAIDESLREHDLEPAPPAADAELLRRMYLDLTGRIPTVRQAADYLADRRPEKTDLTRDELLRGAEFSGTLAELWHNAIVPLDLNRRIVNRPFVAWLAEQIERGRPWNETVRDMLSATGDSTDTPSLGFYQAHRRKNLMGREATRIFLGVRLECVQCHDHPFAKLTQGDYWSTAAFFNRTQVKRESKPIVRFVVSETDDATAGIPAGSPAGSFRIPTNAIRNVGREVPARFLDGTMPRLDGESSYRTPFANWVADRRNPYFARATVNRMWEHFFGHGLVNPVDDLGGLELPSVPGVLELLAADLAASDFDLRKLVRVIVSTRAYRRSASGEVAVRRAPPGSATSDVPTPYVPTPDGSRRTASFELTGLAHRPLRPLTAGQLHDSFCVALEVAALDLLPDRTTLGATPRERFVNLFNTQDAEEQSRDYSQGVLQALRLMNAKELSLDPERISKLIPAGDSPEQAIERLFLRVLSRRPTEAEQDWLTRFVAAQTSAVGTYADLLWALFNSTEFQMNH